MTEIASLLRPLPPRAIKGTVARMYSPRGSYWRQSFIRPDAAYINEGDLIWTATTFDDSWQQPCEYHSDLDLLKLEEVRLISALTFPLAWEAGIVAFHPMPREVLIPDSLDLTTEQARNRISQDLRRVSMRELTFHDYIRLPPALGGSRPYAIRELDLPTDLQTKMFEAIDIEDHLLIRGLNAMLRFSLLSGYSMFLEEAIHALYVGLDASYSIIEQEMRAEGHKNPTSYDRMAWLEANCGERPTGNRYLEHYSDDRIRTVHADSRFGVYPFAPLAADDGYLLFYTLREVYNLLVFREAVKRPVA